MDNLAISGVDSRVRAGFTGVTGGVVEEDQIAGLEIADAVNPGTLAALPLTRCGMGQGVTELLVHVHGKAGAVEAAGGRAAVDIAGAQVLLGGADDAAVPDSELLEAELVRSRKSLRT